MPDYRCGFVDGASDQYCVAAVCGVVVPAVEDPDCRWVGNGQGVEEADEAGLVVDFEFGAGGHGGWLCVIELGS